MEIGEMVYFYVCIKANVIDIGALNYMFALRKKIIM